MYGEFPVTHMIAELERDELLPAILFRTSRKQCDNDVLKLAHSRVGQLDIPRQMALREEVKKIIEKYDAQKEVIFEHPHYNALIFTGAGAHHAGQLLIWRLLLEELMSRGLLRLMIATGTVAAGVDFPARSVIITAHSKRGAEGFRISTSSEFQQMSGRAGRRGKDAVGFCIIAPSPFSDARVIHEVSKRPPEPLRSAYFASPSTVLNLLKYRSVEDLRYTVEKSLASFLDRKAARSMRAEAEELQAQIDADGSISELSRKKAEKRVRRKLRDADELEGNQLDLLERSLEGLERLKYMEGGKLTEKGKWGANLCTTLVLELGECISDGILNDLTLTELVGLVASISGDPHRVYFGAKKNPIKREYFEKMQEILDRVKAAYERPQLSSDIAVVPDAALSVITWMESANWTEYVSLLRLAGVAEGDVARLVGQTAEHLNQISKLTETHPQLAYAAEEGKRFILKPPLIEAITAAA